jgi:flagellar protein FlbD
MVHDEAGDFSMIEVTGVNGKRMIVNAELIKYVEEALSTIITFIDGSKLRVNDSPDILIEKVIKYKRLVHNPELDIG